jgi:ribosomal protein S18 acetylase RimI-like enzyme
MQQIPIFSNPAISIANSNDLPAIKDLLNKAYRGEYSKKGWTSETHLISGDTRTDDQSLQQVLQIPDSVLLKFTDPENKIIGCVNLQKHVTKVYLGMFSVDPVLQGAGIGKQLLQAAEEFTLHLNCNSIYMSVISVRIELINWYKRHGYTDTGERKDFKEDPVSGKHLQQLQFMILEKLVKK